MYHLFLIYSFLSFPFEREKFFETTGGKWEVLGIVHVFGPLINHPSYNQLRKREGLYGCRLELDPATLIEP